MMTGTLDKAKLHQFAATHERNRRQMFDDLCERHRLTPRAFALLPPRAIREMILAARPNIAAQPLAKQMAVLADDKIQRRLDEWLKEKLLVR